MTQIKSITLGELGNNCYLITDQASGLSALVDCTDDSKEMRDFIGSAKLEYILLTHGHFDHCMGLEEVYDATGATVYMSHADLTTDIGNGMFGNEDFELDPPDDTVFVREGDVIEAGSLTFDVLETPGHTPGGITYRCEDCLFTGDTLFRMSCGRYDFPGSSSLDLGHSLEKLRDLPGDYEVYPGHEGSTSLEYERRFNPYMLRPWDL